MDFNTILSTKMSDIEPPKVLPKGTYLFKIARPYSEDKTGENDKWTRVQFQCEVVEAGDQIDDPQALEDFGNPAGVTIRHTFMFNNEADEDPDAARRNDSALNRLKKFLENALEIEADTLKDAMTEATGKPFYGMVDHRPNRDNPEEVYPEIRHTGPVD